LELGDRDLDLAGRDVRVVVALGAAHDLAGDLEAVLGAQPVRALGHLALAEHHLGHAGGVTQVDEDDSAVIAPARHPPGQGDGLPGLLGPERPGLVRAHHGYSTPSMKWSLSNTSQVSQPRRTPFAA